MQRFQKPLHPGELLLDEYLLPRGVSQHALAAELGWSPQKVNELVTGKRGITTESASQLAVVLGTSTELWMYLQVKWSLHLAAQRRKPRIRSVTAIEVAAPATAALITGPASP